jgi:hypothetical protein
VHFTWIDGNDIARRAVVRLAMTPESLDSASRDANRIRIMHVTVVHMSLECRLEKVHTSNTTRAMDPFVRASAWTNCKVSIA